MIRTLKASGGDYTSIVTWEADTDNDLVTAADTEELECYGFECVEGGAVAVTGATVNSSFYRRVFAAAGAEAQTYWDTSTAFRLTTQAGTNSSSESYFRLEHVQVQTTSATVGRTAWTMNGTENRAVGCVFRDGSTGSATNRLLTLLPPAATLSYAINCIGLGRGADTIFGFTFGGSGAAARSHGYNCTVVGCNVNFDTAAREKVLKNCLSFGAVTTGYGTTGGAWTAGTDTNASEDGTAPGTAPLLYVGDPFVNRGANNYHLAAGSALIGRGAFLGGDAALAFTDDFDGDQRTMWSIGADDGPKLHYRERSRIRYGLQKDRYPWIWTRAIRAPAAGGTTAQSASVDAAPVVVHAPAVTTTTGALTRIAAVSTVVIHAPAVTVAANVSRVVSAAPVVMHAPAPATSAGAVTRAVSAAPTIVHAPAVIVSGVLQTRTLTAAPVVIHAPGVATSVSGLTRVVSAGVVVLHAPAPTVSVGAATRTVAAGPVVLHAPAVSTATGLVLRSVSAASLILHAPAVRATNAVAQSATVTAAGMVLYAPVARASAYLNPIPPLGAAVDDLRQAVSVDDLRQAVSIDDLRTDVQLY